MKKKGYIYLAILILILLTAVYVQKNKQPKEPGKTIIKGKFIEGFPEFPVLPEAKIVKSYEKVSQGKVGYEAELKTSQTPRQALLWYRNALEKRGWTVNDEYLEEVEEGDYYLMAQKDNLKVGIFAESEEDKKLTEVTIEFPLQ
ncbi:hypothetical protein A3C98_00370 [Candidatus Roizmanbacteria bacterium RIFCSPHIGHO2_02_FULL_37_15]|nr:MAG: hypothetical protein A2859_00545 [Candidatus Roizmanbacteria bacterium RIFCSPHIGHO2_01_FULL_37_16b]OGK20356.1 MAG: hypothetical protein A3C98_00370 [Candidatus Roizmanbacteria bacterium RIFCSPHIGHO2_02_FULL_37_15]OGK56279.1 MAG: hypothetical protein A3I50_03600 [Candidatus Roizmanbacteria bacterium RIFCSPLOWO2_02_FULL_37_9]